MGKNSRNYLLVGISLIVLLSLLAIFANIPELQGASETNGTSVEITLHLSNVNSNEQLSAFVDEEILLSGEPFTANFSSVDAQKTIKVTCTINCNKGT